LAQGWSIVTDAKGGVIKSLAGVHTGDEVEVLVSDGSFTSKVLKTKGLTT
jgi:exonuclease VII large subunit